MEKEMKIIPPEGYEIDKENSTFGCIKFKPLKKWITYDGIAQKIFSRRVPVQIVRQGIIEAASDHFYDYPNMAIYEIQLKKVLAINQLMNIAKYYNGDWEPNWRERTMKFYIKYYEGGVSCRGLM